MLRSTAMPRHLGAIVVAGMHATLFAGLLSYAPTRSALMGAPIMVEFVPAPKVERPLPPAAPPKPRAVAKRDEPHVEPPPVLVASTETPSPVLAPAPPPAPPTPTPVQVAAPPAPPAPAPLQVSQPNFNAAYLENPAPGYPPIARRNGEHGRVTLRVLVNANGTADEVQVRSSSGFARLDDSARDTVRRWKFVPARRGTQAEPAWVLIPISFRLES